MSRSEVNPVEVGDETPENTTRTSFVRQMIVKNPEVTLEQIQEAWTQAGHPDSNSPKSHDMHMARTKIRNKYGVAEPNDLPRKKNGEINVSGMIRLVLSNNPSYDQKMARKFLQSEGITFEPVLWHQIRNADKKKANAKASQEVNFESPDENQNAGPRARHRGVRGRPFGTRNSRSVDSSLPVDSTIDLVKIEESLDQLIQQATNPNHVQILRAARRHVSMGILTAQN